MCFWLLKLLLRDIKTKTKKKKMKLQTNIEKNGKLRSLRNMTTVMDHYLVIDRW